MGNSVLLTHCLVPLGTLQAPQTPWLKRLGGFFTEIAMYGKKKKPTPGKYGPKK